MRLFCTPVPTILFGYHTHTNTYKHTRRHTHTMKYYAALNENEILLSATSWMYLDGMRISEISQTEKDKSSMISLLCRM